MTIILAGGTGLIGRSLTRELVTRGHSVTLLSRFADTASQSGAKVIQWDPGADGPWTDAVAQSDAVINLAGESLGGGRWTKSRKRRIVQSRVNATNVLVKAMAKSSKSLILVNASAVGYYGDVTEGDAIETAPPGNDFLAQTVVEWEAAAKKAAEHAIRVAMLRTGFVLAPQAPAFKKMILPFKLFAGGPYGSGKQWFPWIHIDDVVAGYVFAVENKEMRGPVNLVSPNPVRVGELAHQLGRALRRPSFLTAPAAGLKILLGEMSDLLLKGQRAVPNLLIGKGFTFRFEHLEDALRDVVSGMKKR